MSFGEETPEGGVPLVGKDPHYFDDPVKDALVKMILELGAQVWINRERIAALEGAITAEGGLSPDAVEHYEHDESGRAALLRERNEFVRLLLRNIEQLADER